MQSFDIMTRIVFGVAALALMALAGGLILHAGWQVFAAVRAADTSPGPVLLDAVGYVVIAIAVFDVGKYLVEEEAIRGREMRRAGEARQSLTKFMSTIAIAVFLEALVTVFGAGKEEVSNMLYPTFLLLAGVALVVGLGVYQKLSAGVEQDIGEQAGPEDAEQKSNPAARRSRKQPSS